jgi:CysZ protein
MGGETLASGRPGVLRRLAEGAWHVPAGFAFLFRNPRLLVLAFVPMVLAVVFLIGGLLLGIVIGPEVNARLAPPPEQVLPGLVLLASLLLWIGTVGACVALGFGVALVLAAPVLDVLSRRVEARVRGQAPEEERGMSFAIAQSLRGAFYFLAANAGIFVLALVPILGPALAVLWGGRALSFQFTDFTLSRRGLAFREKRVWHRQWLPESEGFGLAGMVTLFVPLANFLVAPALVVGATLLVLELEDLARSFPLLESAAPQTEASP